MQTSSTWVIPAESCDDGGERIATHGPQGARFRRGLVGQTPGVSGAVSQQLGGVRPRGHARRSGVTPAAPCCSWIWIGIGSATDDGGEGIRGHGRARRPPGRGSCAAISGRQQSGGLLGEGWALRACWRRGTEGATGERERVAPRSPVHRSPTRRRCKDGFRDAMWPCICSQVSNLYDAASLKETLDTLTMKAGAASRARVPHL